MTTPTREQVVQWEFGEDNDGWYVSENGEQIAYGMSENVADKIVHLNNSRADLEATIAEQAAEIDRLKSTPPDQRQDLHCVVSDISAECRELRQQLAAQQAYAEQIRDALQRLTQFNSSEEYVQVRTEHVSYGRSILSIPQDTTALQEYGEKIVEPYKKDAERYRWLREQTWHDSNICVVLHPKNAVRLGHQCPSVDRLDEYIDAAMKENEQ